MHRNKYIKQLNLSAFKDSASHKTSGAERHF